MKKLSTLLLVLTVYLFAAHAQSTGDYRSAASGNWSDAANWERFNGAAWVAAPSAPASSDGVISILSSHTITINSTVTADQVVVNNGGTLTQESDLNLDNGTGNDLTVNGTWNCSFGVLTLAGPGNVVVGATGMVNFATTGFMLIGAAITNGGTINWQDGALFLTTAITMTNNGTMNISGNNNFANNPGPGLFINTGTVTKTSAGTTTFAMSTASNSGTFNLNSGLLECQTDFTNTGNLTFNTGGWNQIQGIFTHNSGTSINGTGNFTIGGNGSFDLNMNQVYPSTLVFSSAGTISGAGNLTINNDFTFAGTIGGAGTLTINANSTWNNGSLDRALIIPATRTLTLATTGGKLIGAAITNNGAINWQDGFLSFTTAATVTNNGTMNISSNSAFQNAPGPGSFINTGTVTKTSAGTTTFSMSTASNSGTFNVNSGVLECQTNFSNTGNLTFNTGGWNQSQGTFTHNSATSINGTGNFTIGGNGTLDLSMNQVFPSTLIFSSAGTISGAGNLTLNNDFTFGGALGGAGTLTINANSTWNNGSLDRALIIPATRTLTLATAGGKLIGAAITNSGVINWQDGFLSFTTATTVTNNGTMNISGNNAFQENVGPGSFINSGTVTKTSTGTTLFTMSIMTNSTGATIMGLGTMDINAASFTNNGFIAPGLSPGLLTINTGQPLSANSTLSIEMLNGSGAGTGHDQLIRDGDITLAGTLTVTETGTVPNGTYTIINLTSGTVSGSFATTNLPSNYSLQINASNVQLVKSLPLPLHLISFVAQKTTDNKVKLQWVTADEQNVSHFEVERSFDGINYTRIAVVQALNSPVGGTYHYRDERPFAKNNYYRLRMVDLDASYELSPVRKISIDKEIYSLTVYPNPATSFVQVDFSSGEKKIQIDIFDAGGKLWLSKQVNNDLLIKIPVHSLAAGVYYLQVYDGVQKASGVFVKW